MAAAVLWSSFALLLAVVTCTDLRTRLIPDRALVAAAAVALSALVLAAPWALPERLAAAAAAGGFLFVAALARPGGMGLGDVKLAAVLGLYLGRGVLPALLIALACGALWGAAMIAARGWSARSRTIPFAPFLATGAAVARLGADNVDPWS
jgi:leader peptidase (prepilin peptidase) / N-methyltransferase